MNWLQLLNRNASIRRSTLLACAGLAAVVLTAPAGAVPGDLDPTFGTGGKVLTDIGSGSFDEGNAVTIQQDGKIVGAGRSDSQYFALVRHDTEGSLDAGFGEGGKVLTGFGLDNSGAQAVAIQADGKIVAAGFGQTIGGFDFALTRYNADGSFDAGFGSGGKVLTDFGNSRSDFAEAMAIQPDGKIVALGDSRVGGLQPDFALARYNADGSLDSGFGSGGKVLTDFAPVLPGSNDLPRALAIQADGKIVAAGGSNAGGSFDFALARYNADGSLDAGFGAGGKVLTDLGSRSLDRGNAVAIQADGKIVAAGGGLAGGSFDFALIRYNADGSLDAGFGAGGKVLTDLGSGSFDEAKAVAIQVNGKIVAVGGSDAGGSALDFALARYLADGSLDAGFGAGGKVLTDLGSESFDEAKAVAIQVNGKIVAAGDGDAGGSLDFALARYEGEPTATEVSIDIKPGSTRNPIKLASHGLVPLAIVTTDSFDATTVDPSTVCFGDADNADQRDCTEAHGKGHIEDVNGDGRPDLLLHYEVNQTGIDLGDTLACLTGKTFGAASIEGCDSISTL